MTNTQDIVGLQCDSITFTGAGYSIGGTTLVELSLGISHTSGSNTISFPISLASDQSFAVAGGTLTISGRIEGADTNDLTKTGTGTLVLSGPNIYGGATTVSQAILRITRIDALGGTTNGTTVNSGATLELKSVSGELTEPLTLNGSLTMDSSSVTTGGRDLMVGELFTMISSSVTTGGADLTLDGAVSMTSSSITTSGGNIIAAGTPTALTISGVSSVSTGAGTLTLGGDVSKPGGSGDTSVATISGNLSLGASTRTFSVGQSGGSPTIAVSAVISGTSTTAGVIKTGGAKLVFSAANLYQGDTTVSAGTLAIENAGALGPTTSKTTVTGSTLQLKEGISYAAEPLTLNAGTLSLPTAGSSTWTGPVTLESGTSDINTGTGATLTIQGEMGGAGNLRKMGSGTSILPRANPFFTGNTTVGNTATDSDDTGGVLRIQNSLALGTGTSSTVTVNGADSGSTLEIDGSSLNVSRPLTLKGAGFLGAGALKNISGDNTVSGNVVLGSASAVAVDSGRHLTISGNISGSFGDNSTAAFTKIGAGTLRFSGNNTYNNTGSGTDTAVNDGTLELNSSGTAIPGSLTIGPASSGTGTDAVILLADNQISNTSNITINATGQLNLNNFDDAIGALTMIGPGSVTTGSGTLTLGGDVTTSPSTSSATIAGALDLGGSTRTFMVNQGTAADDLVVSASISGGGIAKTGAGTMVLSGANTYGGSTSVTAGVLTIASDGALGATTASTTVSSGAALHVRGGTAEDPLISPEHLTLLGDGGGTGALRAISGTSTLQGTVSLGSDDVAMGADLGSTMTISGVISHPAGVRAITKVGVGKVIFTANNTYTGNTSIDDGTLLINGSQAQSDVVLNGGVLGGTGTVGDITATGGTVDPGTSPGILNSKDINWDDATTFEVDLAGTTAGVGYDQLNVTGTVRLAQDPALPGDPQPDGATLVVDVDPAFEPAAGTSFTIINNDGTDGVTKTFKGLAEGAQFFADGWLFKISYVGGTGNDVVLTRTRFSTSTSLTSDTNPSKFGQSVTFTATVTADSSEAGTPDGTVTFKDGSTTLGTDTLDSSGEATFTTSSLSVGSHSITAEYGGSANYSPSTSEALAQTVEKADTSTSLTSSANPSRFGQSVTFTATVTPVSPGGGTPTGTVTFKDGATTLGTDTLDGSGEATFTTSSLSVGSHSITAEYSGDSSYNPSTSEALTQTVDKSDTSTALTSSNNPSKFGESVTFTATVTPVSPGEGTPTGTVTFKDGVTTLGTDTLDSSGEATFTTSSLSVGSHSITAEYSGDSSYNPSTSSALNQIVEKAFTETTLEASPPSPSSAGQPVTFTATVSRVEAGPETPTGTVTFRDGETVLGTAILDSDGKAELTTSSLSPGTHSITAEYNGDGNFATSESEPLSYTVDPCRLVNDSFFAYDSGFSGGVFVAVGDIDGDGCDDIVTGAGSGGGPHVRVFRNDGTVIADLLAYSPGFTGGVRVAAGDVDGDGRADVITAAGPGGGPHVRSWRLVGSNLQELASFFAYDPAFSGGVFVAAGDVTGDGRADVITGAGGGGGPHVKIFDGFIGADISSGGFFAFSPSFAGGVRVATADVDGGKDEIVVAAGPGGGPHVRVVDGTSFAEKLSFFAYDPGFTGGVFVGGGNLVGNGSRDEIVTGAGAGGGSHVRVFSNSGDPTGISFFAYDPSFTGGVHVAAGNLRVNGVDNIVTGPGAGGGPHIRVF